MSSYVWALLLILAITSGAGVDFNDVTTTLQFNSGTNRQCVDIPVVNDTVLENDEDFFAVLNSTDSSVIVSPDTARVVIEDNDRESSGMVY